MDDPKKRELKRRATKSYKAKNDKKESQININVDEETATTKTAKGKKGRWEEDVEANIIENWKINNVIEDEES